MHRYHSAQSHSKHVQYTQAHYITQRTTNTVHTSHTQPQRTYLAAKHFSTIVEDKYITHSKHTICLANIAHAQYTQAHHKTQYTHTRTTHAKRKLTYILAEN